VTTLFLDLETYCAVPIAHGTHAYAERAEVLLIAQAVDDAPVEVWDCTDGNRAAYLVRLQTAIDAADKIVIHNSAFDRTVLRWQGVNAPVEKVHDTMVQALAHSLPAALGALCDVLEVPFDKAKDKDGKKLIHLFTKPLGRNRTLARATTETHPEVWQDFIEYARLDVEAMREVYSRLPIWNYRGRELEMWRLDQTINDRGIAVDRELAEVAQRAAQRASKRLAQEAAALTGGAVTNTSQRGKTLDHLRQLGLETDDLRGGTIDKLLLRDDLTSDIRALLENRAQASATSPAKYRTLSNAASSDGRLRGTLQFCGASRTGRWGGRLFQPQNLPRPTMKHAEIEVGIAAMKADVEDMLFDNVVELCTSAVRGCLVAAPGKKLVIADLSNIEGRMLAFLAGEQWKLDAFADFDRGIGPDLYKLAYARSFSKKPEDVTPDERQIGKVMELALGYQGGSGAFAKMAGLYGIELPDWRVKELVEAWRKAHSATKTFWKLTEEAARLALATPGKAYTAGKLVFRVDGTWLRVGLPSSRYLCYPNAAIDDAGKLSYEGTDQYTRKWTRLDTYGGKLVENATQAAARDILTCGMRHAEAAGYPIVLHVHDELLCETPDSPEYTHEGLAKLMSTGPQWAVGLPLAAAGFETKRYRKG
jgi:DNA polymerase